MGISVHTAGTEMATTPYYYQVSRIIHPDVGCTLSTHRLLCNLQLNELTCGDPSHRLALRPLQWLSLPCDWRPQHDRARRRPLPSPAVLIDMARATGLVMAVEHRE